MAEITRLTGFFTDLNEAQGFYFQRQSLVILQNDVSKLLLESIIFRQKKKMSETFKRVPGTVFLTIFLMNYIRQDFNSLCE